MTRPRAPCDLSFHVQLGDRAQGTRGCSGLCTGPGYWRALPSGRVLRSCSPLRPGLCAMPVSHRHNPVLGAHSPVGRRERDVDQEQHWDMLRGARSLLAGKSPTLSLLGASPFPPGSALLTNTLATTAFLLGEKSPFSTPAVIDVS